MRVADEPIYLDEEDLLDARLKIAEDNWKEFMDSEHPELVLIDTTDDFEECDDKINTLCRKFIYYSVDDTDKRQPCNGIYFVEFRDRLTEVTDQYVILE